MPSSGHAATSRGVACRPMLKPELTGSRPSWTLVLCAWGKDTLYALGPSYAKPKRNNACGDVMGGSMVDGGLGRVSLPKPDSLLTRSVSASVAQREENMGATRVIGRRLQPRTQNANRPDSEENVDL
ncbi:hypothetical protein PMIN01_10646 [Paraphaeosphaeria minitans]|uniref:Uncharacterized protein n=1 Tax=Paraphaeosphaeria minitans TaxID=565426 RepID=A0A9P6GCD4_9PLEO|nr:hypothetical protein PMIN01_10646 [Paraphaeosphaeria minitans]